MAIFLTSDLHFGHQLVAEDRGFATSEEHDREVARRWGKSGIQDSDDVFVLGDVALGGWRDQLSKVAALPGRKHLIVGNHDRCFPGTRNSHNYVRAYLEVFESVQQAGQLNYRGTKFLMAHLPYEGDHGPDRWTQWRLRNEGNPILHGHTHATKKVTLTRLGTIQICVGLDAWGLRPVALGEVAKLFGETQEAIVPPGF